MRFETTSHGQEMQIKLQERLSFSDHAKFRDVLDRIGKAAPKSCTFDLSELESVDSAALGMLMIAHDQSRKQGWSMTLKSPRDGVMKVLQLACFDKILTIA